MTNAAGRTGRGAPPPCGVSGRRLAPLADCSVRARLDERSYGVAEWSE